MTLACLIVDDNPEFLGAARELLEQEGIVVAGVARTGEEAVRRAAELRPDVTLIDIDLGGEDGFVVARRLASDDSGAGRLILISTHTEDEFGELIEASPAIGFLAKSSLSAEAIERLAGPASSSRA